MQMIFAQWVKAVAYAARFGGEIKRLIVTDEMGFMHEFWKVA